MNEASEADLEYEDIPYVSYEYPSRFRNRIKTGDRFVYYRGRRRTGGGRQPQVYLGVGVVGEIRRSQVEGRLVCDVLDGSPFAEPVPFKDANGRHLEPGGASSGYFQPGVRKISEEVYTEIVSRAGAEPQPAGAAGGAVPASRGGYASPAVAREVERQSRRAVADLLLARFPDARITDMPTNNPGFDLGTDIPGFRYVEVKGTQAGFPRFFLSEGERQFGSAHRDEYLFAVVFGMDLAAETHRGIELSRAPLGSAHGLEVFQWVGVLPIRSMAADPWSGI